MMASTMETPISPAPASESRCLQFLESVRKALFVVGSALLVFVSARNSITWHLQQVWGASGNFWQSQWNNIYEFFGRNEAYMDIVGTFAVTMAIFWIGNLLLLILDTTGKPQFLLKYKIQEDREVPVDKTKLRRAIVQVLFNQVIAGIPFMLVMHYLYKWRGCSVGGELPTFHWVVLELIVFTLVEELCFYYSHRLLHHRRIYKYIHKRHHEWTAPIGIISLYAHPVEHVMSNIGPPALGPLIMGSHLATAWMWFCLAILSTIVAHSGYHFPLLPSPEAHDFHHQKFTSNFGVLGVLDRLHGTDEQFRESQSYQRHSLLFGLTPLSQQFPDATADKKK